MIRKLLHLFRRAPVCPHKMKIPHLLDGGGWRWTCGDCYADLRA